MDHLATPPNPSYPIPKVPYHGLRYSETWCVHTKEDSTRSEKFLCEDCARSKLDPKSGEADAFLAFNTFPARMGWIAAWQRSEYKSTSTRSPPLPGVLQAWLYEGVLTKYTNGLFPEDSFLETDNEGSTWLRSRNLTNELKYWRRARSQMSETERTAYEDTATKLYNLQGQICFTVLPRLQQPTPIGRSNIPLDHAAL